MKPSFIRGYYEDSLFDSRGRLILKTDLKANLIVSNCGIYLSALVKNMIVKQNRLFLAVGSGDESWDTLMPKPDPGATALKKEAGRIEVKQIDVQYADQKRNLFKEPTNRIVISVDIKASGLIRGTSVLREFGLFGVIGSIGEKKPFMIDYVIHPVLDLSGDRILKRKLYVVFDTSPSPSTGTGLSFIDKLPVVAIDGVGEIFASKLTGNGIRTIKELIELDPFTKIKNIPYNKLLEWQAKAGIVRECEFDFTPFKALIKISVSEILEKNPETLCALPGMEKVTLNQVKDMQKKLALFQLCFDESFLKGFKFSTIFK